MLAQRQIVICSAQGPSSISHVYADFSGLGLHILPGLVKNYHLPAQVSGNNYGTLVYTVNLTIYVPNENIPIGSHVESRESNALKYITNMLLSEQYNMYMYIYYVQVHNGLRTMICLQ